MKKRNHKYMRRPAELNRIERKCDRILSELLVLRRTVADMRTHGIDEAIDRMHRAARRMREQCEWEHENVRRLFHSQNKE